MDTKQQNLTLPETQKLLKIKLDEAWLGRRVPLFAISEIIFLLISTYMLAKYDPA